MRQEYLSSGPRFHPECKLIIELYRVIHQIHDTPYYAVVKAQICWKNVAWPSSASGGYATATYCGYLAGPMGFDDVQGEIQHVFW